MLWNVQKCFSLLLITLSMATFVLVSGNHAEEDIYVSKSWVTTRIKIEKLKFTWTIENYNSFFLENGVGLKSPLFWNEDNDFCKYQLDLYTNGYNYQHREHVGLVLRSLSCPVKLNYRIGLLNAQTAEINVSHGAYQFFKEGRSESLSSLSNREFINKEYLLQKSNGILSNDKLTIFCELNATLGLENTSGRFEQPQLDSRYLGKDLTYLFENRNFTDVILSVEGKEFYALKPILAARSPVFRVMFEQDTTITKVEILDLRHEVVKEMLRYIYTEEVFNFEYVAHDLLAASVKYDLEGLKVLCAEYMAGNLTIENASEFYILSDTYSANDLKMKVKDFIVLHAPDVVRNSGFKSIIQTHPHLVEEIFGAVADDRSKTCIV